MDTPLSKPHSVRPVRQRNRVDPYKLKPTERVDRSEDDDVEVTAIVTAQDRERMARKQASDLTRDEELVPLSAGDGGQEESLDISAMDGDDVAAVKLEPIPVQPVPIKREPTAGGEEDMSASDDDMDAIIPITPESFQVQPAASAPMDVDPGKHSLY